MRAIMIAAVLVAAGVGGAVVLNMADKPKTYQNPYEDPAIIEGAKHITPEIEAAANGPKTQWTKSEFDSEAFGKSKAQIRAEFGKPDNVDDGTDTWYYWHLPVFDEAAGIQVHNTSITFEGLGGVDDRVAKVRYD